MKRTLSTAIVSLSAVAILPLLALAQTNPPVTIIYHSPTGTTTPGQTGASFGSFTLTTPIGTSAQILSLPLTLTTSGGGIANDLTNCQFYNFGVSNSSLTTGSNIPSSISSIGPTLFIFNTPLGVSNNSTTITLRCDVRSSAGVNGIYVFAPGTPNLVPAPPNPSALNADLTVFSTLIRGATNAPVAAFTFAVPAGGANYNVTALPITAAYGNGLTSAHFSNCVWRNDRSANALTSGIGTVAAGSSIVPLLSTLYLPNTEANPVSLVLSCTVSALAPVGGTLTLTSNRSAMGVTNAATGGTVTPIAGSINSSGGTATVYASTPGTGGGTVAPPNTGAKPLFPTTLVVVLSLMTLVAGYVFFVRTEQ